MMIILQVRWAENGGVSLVFLSGLDKDAVNGMAGCGNLLEEESAKSLPRTGSVL